MTQTIEEILEQDPHVNRIETSDYDVPNMHEFGVDKLKPGWQGGDSIYYRYIKDFLTYSLTVDDFPSNWQGHRERTDWKQAYFKSRKDVHEFLQNNPLRKAISLAAIMGLDHIKGEYTNTDKEKFESLIDNCMNYFRQDMSNYEREERETQVTMIRELQLRVYAVALGFIFGLVSSQSSLDVVQILRFSLFPARTVSYPSYTNCKIISSIIQSFLNG